MVAFLFVSFTSFVYKSIRKVVITWCLFGLLSCKDFKSWESRYLAQANIIFKQKTDNLVPEKLKDLHSVKLESRKFLVVSMGSEKKYFSFSATLPIDFNPSANQVSFEIEDDDYYQKVTVFYERMVSLISPDAGGLQQQYTIQNVQFYTKDHKKPIFKAFKIEKPVPFVAKGNAAIKDNQSHVTIYY
ncbi:hypothetical protein [Cardinium endosymbiont of Tipula unca]|uniref:hypothetical protein n=1 Tax=Cardinium endosymbiont of Tipula unca TaxID=3066216 RepID=UPI0030CAA5E8